MLELTPKQLVAQAVIKLQKEHPFFSYLLMSVERIEVSPDDERIKTMAVNAKEQLFYNPSFIKTLSKSQIKGVLCHEIMHIILGHMFRLSNAIPAISNIAADLIVNTKIKKEGFVLPSGCVEPDSAGEWKIPKDWFKDNIKIKEVIIKDINNLTSEDVYLILEKYLPKDFKNNQGFDLHIADEEDSWLKNKNKPTISQALQDKITQAAIYAKSKGKLPNGLEELVDDLVTPKVNWRVYLQRFLSSHIPVDFTYSRLHKKSYALGVAMPHIVKECVDVVVHIDTSGSTRNELPVFLSEMHSMLQAFPVLKMTLIVCDAQIHDVVTFDSHNSNDLLNMSFKGWGGTSHRPVVEYINEELPHTKCLVSLTDGCSDIEQCYPDLPLNCHNLIVLAGNFNPKRLAEELSEFAEIISL